MDKKLYITPELMEDLTKLNRSLLNHKGHEVVNPKPLLLHFENERPLTIHEQIQRCLRYELSRQMISQGMESFEEADDFEVGDDFDDDPQSLYQMMHEEEPIDGLQKSPISSKEEKETPMDLGEAETDPAASE